MPHLLIIHGKGCSCSAATAHFLEKGFPGLLTGNCRGDEDDHIY